MSTENGVKRKLSEDNSNGSGVDGNKKLKAEAQEAGLLLFSGLTDYDERNDKYLSKSLSIKWSPHRFEVLDGIRIKDVSSGIMSFFFYAISADGKVYSWGFNQKGQLGLGDCKMRRNPTLIESLSGYNVVAVATGKHHGLFLTDKGDVFACGDNSSGQCGIGKKQELISEPTKLDYSGPPIVKIACGGEFTLILDEDGQVYSFGHPEYGQLGNGSENKELTTKKKFVYHYTYSPTPIVSYIEKDPDVKDIISHGQPKISKIACGVHHCCVIDQDQRLFTWGFGGYGRLGHSSTSDEYFPRLLKCWYRITKRADGGITDVYCGQQFTMVKTIVEKCVYLFGQQRLTAEANMYPKVVDDLGGWNTRDIVCNQQGWIACADNSVIASQPSPAFGTLAMGEKCKSSAPPKIVSTLDDVYCIRAGLGYMHSLYIVRDQSEKDKTAIEKFPSMKLEEKNEEETPVKEIKNVKKIKKGKGKKK